jgi:hypothetical protein
VPVDVEQATDLIKKGRNLRGCSGGVLGVEENAALEPVEVQEDVPQWRLRALRPPARQAR